MFPEAYDHAHLEDLVDANSSTPDWVTADVLARIIDHAQQRADARGEDSSLDADGSEHLIMTDWASFVDDWGYSDGDLNQIALGVHNTSVSSGKQADLFNDTVVVQSDWLKSGDGRKTRAEPYDDEDYDQSNEGELWIPSGAQDYIAIIELTDELIHGEPALADAM